MVVTNDEDRGWEARSFRDHGYDVKARMNMLALEEKLPYIHNRVGFNFRMTEMQSIVGINELARLETWNLPRRFEYAKMYREALGKLEGVKSLPVDTEGVSALTGGSRSFWIWTSWTSTRPHSLRKWPAWAFPATAFNGRKHTRKRHIRSSAALARISSRSAPRSTPARV